MRHVSVRALPDCRELFTTPDMTGVVVDEDETHIWIGSIANRYPKYMVEIRELGDYGELNK